MEDPKKQQPGQINIELTAEVAQGIYSNLALISHSQTEFILDYIQVLPGTPKAPVRSRIILAPQHAKRLLNALRDNIDKYERINGEIPVGDQGTQGMPPNFGGPTGYA